MITFLKRIMKGRTVIMHTTVRWVRVKRKRNKCNRDKRKGQVLQKCILRSEGRGSKGKEKKEKKKEE
jgi:hypothetical protein